MQPDNSTTKAVSRPSNQPIRSGTTDYFNDPSSGQRLTILGAWRAATCADMDLPPEILSLLRGER